MEFTFFNWDITRGFVLTWRLFWINSRSNFVLLWHTEAEIQIFISYITLCTRKRNYKSEIELYEQASMRNWNLRKQKDRSQTRGCEHKQEQHNNDISTWKWRGDHLPPWEIKSTPMRYECPTDMCKLQIFSGCFNDAKLFDLFRGSRAQDKMAKRREGCLVRWRKKVNWELSMVAG